MLISVFLLCPYCSCFFYYLNKFLFLLLKFQCVQFLFFIGGLFSPQFFEKLCIYCFCIFYLFQYYEEKFFPLIFSKPIPEIAQYAVIIGVVFYWNSKEPFYDQIVSGSFFHVPIRVIIHVLDYR